MKYNKVEKKQLITYTIIAFGVPYLLGLLMWYGYANGLDVSVFPNAQMMYPAAGVMLAYLITRGADEWMPRRFFVTFLVLTVIMIFTGVASLIWWYWSGWVLVIQLEMIGGSILGWIMLLTEKRQKRIAYGMKWQNWKKSMLCILIFLALYLGRTVFSYVVGGELSTVGDIVKNPMTWVSVASLPVNFFVVFIAFYGEEYGWRYFLQPMLQKRFGLRLGVIILGVVWGLWHAPVNFFYYSPGSGLASMALQQVTCITLGIFFAWAYMKTQNIWVPVILHYLNNNLVPIITANYGADVLQNQQTAWESFLPALVVNGILFGGFILTKEFRKRNKPESVSDESSEAAQSVVK